MLNLLLLNIKRNLKQIIHQFSHKMVENNSKSNPLVKTRTLEEVLKGKKILIEGPEPTQDLSYEFALKNEDLKMIEEGIILEDFSDAMAKRNLDMEFRLLRRMTESNHHLQILRDFDPDINRLNRYNNIIPFSHTEVKVPKFKKEYDGIDTYINANYVKNILDEPLFIATQGPLEVTFQNFWKMIYDQNAELIIMLCNLQENGRSQCEKYWPALGKSYEYPSNLSEKELKITCLSENNIGKQIQERTFSIESNMKGIWEKKTVCQLQWMGWPDHGCPLESDNDVINTMLDFMIKFYIENESEKKIVVHCSAGVGRTGTLITLFNIKVTLAYYSYLSKLSKVASESKKENKISIFGIVRRLREQRWGMVNTSEQYNYIYRFTKKLIEFHLKGTLKYE